MGVTVHLLSFVSKQLAMCVSIISVDVGAVGIPGPPGSRNPGVAGMYCY